MTTFLGPVGSLIPVKCASTLTSSGGREVSFTRTLGKQKAFFGQVRAREWSVDIGLAKPGELSGLRWLAEYSSSPLVWYSPDAVVGNILTPDQAALEAGKHNGISGPLVQVQPGIFVKSVIRDPDRLSVQIEPGPDTATPHAANKAVTVSAWVRGDSSLGVYWRDAEGTSLGLDQPSTVNYGEWTRISRTIMPPPGSAQANLSIRCEQMAGPAVTLTDQLMPYSPGQGSKQVALHGLTGAVIRAYQEHQFQSLSFMVSEVG